MSKVHGMMEVSSGSRQVYFLGLLYVTSTITIHIFQVVSGYWRGDVKKVLNAKMGLTMQAKWFVFLLKTKGSFSFFMG